MAGSMDLPKNDAFRIQGTGLRDCCVHMSFVSIIVGSAKLYDCVLGLYGVGVNVAAVFDTPLPTNAGGITNLDLALPPA